MGDELLTEIVSLYRAGKRVRKALRVVKRPTVLGLLSIARAIAGRRQSKDVAGARKQISRREERDLGQKDRHPASALDKAGESGLVTGEKSVGGV